MPPAVNHKKTLENRAVEAENQSAKAVKAQAKAERTTEAHLKARQDAEETNARLRQQIALLEAAAKNNVVDDIADNILEGKIPAGKSGEAKANTEQDEREFKAWYRVNFSKEGLLLSQIGKTFTVVENFNKYLKALDYTKPREIWADRLKSIKVLAEIRAQHAVVFGKYFERGKPFPTLTDKQVLTASMLAVVNHASKSEAEKRIANALAEAEKIQETNSTNAVISLLTKSKPANDCTTAVVALDHLCKYLSGTTSSPMAKKMQILGFITENLDSCKPWTMFGQSRDEWVDYHYDIAGLNPAPVVETGSKSKKDSKEEEDVIDYDRPF
jgi:hypothetical protein